MICIIFSCPASSAVRDGSNSVPTIGEWTREDGSQSGFSCYLARPLVSVVCAPSSGRCRLPADNVGQKPEKGGAFDGPRQPPLLLGENRRNPTRHDLAALGDVTLQEPHVLVVDLRGIGAGKR